MCQIDENLKTLFKKKGYIINWKELEKQSLDQTINTLAMASPFSLEEKQVLLETIDIKNRKIELEKILKKFLHMGILDKDYGICKPRVRVTYKRSYIKIHNVRLTIDQDIEYIQASNKKESFFKSRFPLFI